MTYTDGSQSIRQKWCFQCLSKGFSDVTEDELEQNIEYGVFESSWDEEQSANE